MSKRSKSQQKQLKEKVQELNKKLILGHEKSHVPHKNGMVFIGNSRIGKSTLAALLKGLTMQVCIDNNELRIEPQLQQQRKKLNLIQHSMTSVTQFPNIYEIQIEKKFYTIVDLPGFKDTSYEKEICNWSYIKSILSQMDKILFVMVIQVHTETREIKSDEIQMMHRFAQAFPSNRYGVAKQNVCTVVNFMENVQTQNDQNIAKAEIREKAIKQLKIQDLLDYYETCFDSHRLLIVQKVKEKDQGNKKLKNGVPFTLPKLFNFLKNNVSRAQKTEQSPYRIDLTKQIKKGSKTKDVIIQYTKQILLGAAQKFQKYKELFAQLLLWRVQKQGTKCESKEYKILADFYQRSNLTSYKTVKVVYNSYQQSQYKQVEQIVYYIVKLFQIMPLKQQQRSLEERTTKLQRSFSRFLGLMQNLCKIMFGPMAFNQIKVMNEDVWKSIIIDCKNILYLANSLQDFKISDENDPIEKYFHQNCLQLLHDYYNDNMVRSGPYKDQLQKYLKYVLNKNKNETVRHFNLDEFNRITQICNLNHFKQLKNQGVILLYKTYHRKLQIPLIFNDRHRFCQIYEKLMNLQLKNDELKKIQQWKKCQPEWKIIINKGYIQFIRLLSSTNYDKKKIVKYYLKLNAYFDQLFEILKSIYELVQNQEFDKLDAYNLFVEASQNMEAQFDYVNAMKCWKMVQKMFMFEDENKVIEAKTNYINLMQKIATQQFGDQVDNYLSSLSKQPWSDVTQKQYEAILKQTVNHVKSSIPQSRKDLQLNKMNNSMPYSAKQSDKYKKSTSDYYSPQVQIKNNGHLTIKKTVTEFETANERNTQQMQRAKSPRSYQMTESVKSSNGNQSQPVRASGMMRSFNF